MSSPPIYPAPQFIYFFFFFKSLGSGSHPKLFHSHYVILFIVFPLQFFPVLPWLLSFFFHVPRCMRVIGLHLFCVCAIDSIKFLLILLIIIIHDSSGPQVSTEQHDIFKNGKFCCCYWRWYVIDVDSRKKVRDFLFFFVIMVSITILFVCFLIFYFVWLYSSPAERDGMPNKWIRLWWSEQRER